LKRIRIIKGGKKRNSFVYKINGKNRRGAQVGEKIRRNKQGSGGEYYERREKRQVKKKKRGESLVLL
jgi:hypothetical protein